MWPSVAIAVSSEVARAEGAAIGVVTDLTGIPIPGVRVRLSCPGEPARLATSGHQGAYRFDDVPAKVCALTVSKRGFDRVKVRGVALDHAYVTVVPTVRLSEALRSAGEIVLHPAYGAVYAGGEVRTWLPEPERLPLHQRFGLASSLVTRPAPTADRRYRQVVNGVDVTDVFGERSVSLLRDDDVQLVATSGGGALDPGGDVVSAWLPMPEPVWNAQVLWEPAAAGVRAGVSGGGSVGHAGTLGADWGYQRTEVAGDALSAHRARVNALAEVDGNHVSVEGMVEPSSYEGSGDTRALALGATRWRWYASRSVATDLSVSALRHTTVTGADTRAQMTQAARGAVTARPGDHAVGVGFGGSRTDAERVTAPSSAWYVTGARGWAFVNEAWRPSVFDVQGGARLDVIRVAHADDVLSTVDLSPRVSVGVSPGRSTAVSVSAARYGPMTDLDPVRVDDEVAVVLDPSAGRQVDALTAAWDQAFGAGVLRADVHVQRASGPDGSARGAGRGRARHARRGLLRPRALGRHRRPRRPRRDTARRRRVHRLAGPWVHRHGARGLGRAVAAGGRAREPGRLGPGRHRDLQRRGRRAAGRGAGPVVADGGAVGGVGGGVRGPLAPSRRRHAIGEGSATDPTGSG